MENAPTIEMDFPELDKENWGDSKTEWKKKYYMKAEDLVDSEYLVKVLKKQIKVLKDDNTALLNKIKSLGGQE